MSIFNKIFRKQTRNHIIMKENALKSPLETTYSHTPAVQDQKTDRRVRRTRTLLQQSLIRLMAKKEIKDITVKELCELADITRGTFYLHYSDIYDVLRNIEHEMFVEFNEILNRSLDSAQRTSSPENVLTDIFFFLERYRDTTKVMMGPHGDMAFVNHLKNLVKERIYQALEKKKTDCEYDYAEAFVISGCIGVVETWLYHPAPLPPREIAKICCDMLVQGLDLT